MIRLVLAVLGTVVLVAFVVLNLHHVPLSLPVGPQVQVRLIYLVVGAFAIGAASSGLFKLVRRAQQKRASRGDSRSLARGAYGDEELVID